MNFIAATLATASASLTALVLPIGPLTTTWVPPLDGPLVVVNAFDPPPPWQPWRAGHRGVDLAAPAGAIVRAAGAGTVSFAGPLAGRGVVVVRHGALRTTYEPLQTSVKIGQRVAPGTPVGVVTASGSRCAGRTCLHWGLIRGAVYLDPLLLLGEPPRLLPQHQGAGTATVAAAVPREILPWPDPPLEPRAARVSPDRPSTTRGLAIGALSAASLASLVSLVSVGAVSRRRRLGARRGSAAHSP